MSPNQRTPISLSLDAARRVWIRAQRLDEAEPFGRGHDATLAAIEHLGYLQIDTINVIERCHHHILWSRIPAYRREHLRHAQTRRQIRLRILDSRAVLRPDPRPSLLPSRNEATSPIAEELVRFGLEGGSRKVLPLIRRDGALSIRDIDDDVLVEKDHAWASRKPSKRALQLAFFTGALTVSERSGMLKTYELMDRHFGWDAKPKPASEREVVDYLLTRALRSQGLVSLDSICHLDAKRKAAGPHGDRGEGSSRGPCRRVASKEPRKSNIGRSRARSMRSRR